MESIRLAFALVSTLAFVHGPAAHAQILDQENDPTGAVTLTGGITVNDHLAQTFTVAETGQLTSVEIFGASTGPSVEFLTVDVRATTAGVPNDPDFSLGAVAISVNDLPTTPAFHRIDLRSQGIQVNAGEVLAIVVRYSGMSGNVLYTWQGGQGDPYPSGAAFVRNLMGAPSWAPSGPGRDFGFRTQVRTSPTCVEDQLFDPTGNITVTSGVSVNIHKAQTFTVDTTGQLTGVEIFGRRNLEANESVTIDIRATASGIPINADTPLAQASIPVNSFPPSGEFFSVDLTSAGLMVNTGDVLALVVRYSGPNPNTLFAWQGDGGDPYPNGGAFLRTGPVFTGWTPLGAAVDFGFRTCVDPPCVLDQEYDPTGISTVSSGVSRDFHKAQTFTVGLTGQLNKVEIYGTGGNVLGNSMILDIRATAAGVPIDPDTPLLQVTIPVSSLAPYDTFYAVDLSSFGLQVNAGDVLALVLRHGSPDPNNLFSWKGGQADPYPGGQAYFRNMSGIPNWTSLGTGFELGFRICVDPSNLSSSCNGDGGDQMGCTSCPCGNDTHPGTVGGCVHSASALFGGAGSRLLASGSPSVSLPAGSTADLELSMEHMPPMSTAVMFSGDAVAPQNMANPCFGFGVAVPLGASGSKDGLRCAVGNLIRHGNRQADVNGEIKAATGPSRTWGGAAGPNVGLAVQGGFMAGQTRYFQATHRDLSGAVCLTGLNTSQAIKVMFTP